jgi:pantetheine-phosphate adenylyltransferase
LHVGHEKLLARAFSLGERVLIGVSGDSLAASFHKEHLVNPFEVRVRGLKRFLKSQDWIQRAKITELHDSFGPALRRKRLQALVVSAETRHSTVELNRLRVKMGLAPLRIHVVALTRAREGGPISASRIRRGEIDREGNLMQEQH